MASRAGSSYETLKRFDQLPYKKALLDDAPHPELECAVHARRKNGKPLGNVYISDIVTITGKRAFELTGISIIKFLN